MEDEELEIVRLLQDAPPAHHTMKMEGFRAFSVIEKQEEAIYESETFEVGGYNWKLLLYPSGKSNNKEMEYISLSVAIDDTPKSCVSAMIRVFVYNHAKDKYLAVQDRKARRYHALKTEHGFDQVLPLEEFLDPTSGYLVNDCCAFGAEVHVIESAREVHSSIVSPYLERGVHQWKIDKFFKEECHYSTEFPVGPCDWKIQLYPDGFRNGKGNSISAFLYKCDGVKRQTVYAKFKIALQHQNGGHHRIFEGHARFDDKHVSWGTTKLISLADLHDTSKGYLKKDTLIIEASVEAYFCQTSESEIASIVYVLYYFFSFLGHFYRQCETSKL